jgi:glycosyltransferase involved in cell wall biosynthesis
LGSQVWRVAFFGRLEERKGIKLFVEAVDRLQEEYDIEKLTEFEVYIVGPEASIDMVPLTPPDHPRLPHYNTKRQFLTLLFSPLLHRERCRLQLSIAVWPQTLANATE